MTRQDAPDYVPMATLHGVGVDCPRCKGWTNLAAMTVSNDVGTCMVCGHALRVPLNTDVGVVYHGL